MKLDATWIKENYENDEIIQISTYSQSVCMAVQSYNTETDPIREILQGHMGDQHPMDNKPFQHPKKRAGQGSQDRSRDVGDVDRSLSIAFRCGKCFRTKSNILLWSCMHSAYNKDRESLIATRKDQVAQEQTQNVKHLAFRAYNKTCSSIHDSSTKKFCQKCNHTSNPN